MEQMEERGGMGELLQHKVRTGPKQQGTMKELKTFNATDQTLVFLKCFQKLLQDQAKVVNSWFECTAYSSVLKQVWNLVLLDCELLDTEALYSYVPASHLQRCAAGSACGEQQLFPLQACARAVNGVSVFTILRIQIKTEPRSHILSCISKKAACMSSAQHAELLYRSLVYRLLSWGTVVQSASLCLCAHSVHAYKCMSSNHTKPSDISAELSRVDRGTMWWTLVTAVMMKRRAGSSLYPSMAKL